MNRAIAAAWLARIISLLLCVACVDATVASIHGSVWALAAAGAGASLAIVSLALLWERPWIAAALSLLGVTGAFAVSAIQLGYAETPGAISFTGLTPGDAVAAALALALVAAAVAAPAAFRSPFVRVLVVLAAVYALVPLVWSVGRGGLHAAVTAPPLGTLHGADLGIYGLLPLAALVALVMAVVSFVQRRGARGATALVLAIALVAANQAGAYRSASLSGEAASTPDVSPQPTADASAAVATSAPLQRAATANKPYEVPTPASETTGTGPLAVRSAENYAALLGPAMVDAGDGTGDNGTAAVSAAKSAISVLGARDETPSPASATSEQLRTFGANIPQREYSLTALSDSLPNDPVALYAFVRDTIKIDPYDGAMRGPLGTWLSRAGSPSDKALLLAWLLVNKGQHLQFVRGELSSAEQKRIAEAPENTVATQPKTLGAKSDAYFDALTKKSAEFADWSRGVLERAKVPLGAIPVPASRLGSRHYWLQIERNGRLVDLDPTLRTAHDGEHLGTVETSFRPSLTLPADEYHWVQLRVAGEFTDGPAKVVMSYTGRSSEIAYSPIRLGFGPKSERGSGTSAPVEFAGALQVGSQVVDQTSLQLAHVRSLSFEIVRKGPGTAQRSDRRWIIGPNAPVADRPYRLQSLVTLMVAPGRGGNAFTAHQQVTTLARLFDDHAQAARGQKVDPHVIYPLRIADFFVRDDLMAERLNAERHSLLARSRPNIALQQSYLVRGGGNDGVEVAFDIVDNSMSSLIGGGAGVADTNLARGYADTQLERDVSEEPSPYGTIALFAAARTSAVSTVVVNDRSTSGALAVPSNLRDGLDQTLASGQVAISPGRPLPLQGENAFGWWAVDPATGNTVGRMTGGAGTAASEYALLVRTVAFANVLLNGAQAAKKCSKSGFGSVGCVTALCVEVSSALLFTFASPGASLAAGNVVQFACKEADFVGS